MADQRSQPSIAGRLREIHSDMHLSIGGIGNAAADRIEELEAALREARSFIDPDADPPRISNREMVQQIDAALQSEKTT